MALDRQRILTELGSVVNQLQSADCGCMGKLFNDPSQNAYSPMGNPVPTCGGCRRGCYGHGGHGMWNSGRPCSDPNAMNAHQITQRPCMNHCNPPKLYADTYNYLTENLMQPTIKEVYHDLSTITPNNTIMNNPTANQIVSQDAYAAQNAAHPQNGYNNIDNMQNNMNTISANETQSKGMNQMGMMGGMGPQIMNMIRSNQMSNPSNVTNQGDGNLKEQMLIDAPNSPHGVLGITPLSAPMGNHEGIYKNNNVAENVNYQNANPNAYNNMPPTYMNNATSNPQNTQGFQNMSNMNINPATQQTAETLHHNNGKHAPGIAKFNEMFPGVMKGMGGDLNFDPMAMAIQMNPANQQSIAMATMQKMMIGNRPGINNMLNRNANLTPERPGVRQPVNNNISQSLTDVPTPIPQAQNITTDRNISSPVRVNQESNLYRVPTETNHQAYTALTGQPVSQQNLQQQEYKEQQQVMDPTSDSAVPTQRLPTLYAGAGQQNDQLHITDTTAVSGIPNTQQMIKEPIFPADTSKYYVPKKQRNEYNTYNTLGQPVQMLPAQMYHTREPSLPQTLSPQPPPNAPRYSNVKSTVSKISIMGEKPTGRTPSRNQLQHIYNQYKGSQSFTQNNVRAPDNVASYSDGKINVARTNERAPQQVPIEKIGGDTIANNQVQDQRTNKQVMRQIGDVPGVIKPKADVGEQNQQIIKTTRNGLQDQVYTSYPTTAAWSFHGDSVPRYSSAYRNRYRF